MSQTYNNIKYIEYNKKLKLKKAWNISYKYSSIINNKLLLLDNELFYNIFKQFKTELKSNKISFNNKSSFITNWIEFINCVEKSNEKNIKSSGKKLYYTNYLKNVNL